MKKLATFCIALILTICSMLGGLVGCNREEGEAFREDASHLYVGAYAAGYGTQFAKDLKVGFEEHWKDYSFEEGKMGVQVHVLDALDGQSIMGNFEMGDYEVIFTGNSDYYQYALQNKIIPIDDVIDDKLNEYGENKSLRERMSADAIAAATFDGHIYAVPYVASGYKIAINVDLWNSKQLYFAKGGCPSEYLRDGANSTNDNCDPALPFPEGYDAWSEDLLAFTGYDANRSAGPDGKYGTIDDGQPATHEEFLMFCDNAIFVHDVQPIHWPGYGGTTQTSKMLLNWVLDNLGAEQASLRYKFTGTAKNLISVDPITGEKTHLPDVELNNTNGYWVRQQEAIYDILCLTEEILASTSYYNATNNSTHIHTDAQDDFISGGIISGKKEIAMLVDGNWWMNEAKAGFDVITETYGEQYAAANRRFQMLSWPKQDNDHVGEPQTESASVANISAINSKIANDPVKLKMAKEFLKFAFTNANNVAFTKLTGIIRPYEVTFTEDDLDGLDFFTTTELERQKNTVFFYDSSENEMVRNNYFTMFNSEQFWLSTIMGNDYQVPNTAMLEGKTAAQLFNGMAWSQDTWDNRYRDYYN